MEYREIRELLERYWEGKSTLEEEKRLRDFFSTHRDVLPPDLQQASELFSFFRSEADQTMEEAFLPETLVAENNKRRFLWKRYWKYAAVFLLLLGGVLFYQMTKQPSLNNASVSYNTYENPEKAFEATQQALQILAGNFNKGKNEVQKLALFDKAKQKVGGY